MGSEYTFCDYVNAGGEGVVREWLRDVPAMVRKKFNTQFGHLEVTPHAKWTRPYVAAVGDGLLEARVEWGGSNYRILFTHMPGRKPTLLYGFVKPGGPVPPEDRARALARRVELRAEPAAHQVEYRHD